MERGIVRKIEVFIFLAMEAAQLMGLLRIFAGQVGG